MSVSGVFRQTWDQRSTATTNKGSGMLSGLLRAIGITVIVTVTVLVYMGYSTYTENMQVNADCNSSSANIFFPSRSDNLSIAARYTANEQAERAVILIHGLENCKDDLRIVATEQAYQAIGYATLAIDMRSHGQSEAGGQLHGFGSLRANDVLGAFDWLTGQGVPGERIVLHGQSLGGSAALFSSLREPRITRVVAEAPILNFDKIVRDGGSPAWFLPIFKAIGRVRGFDLSRQPVAACETGRTNQTILILHAAGDPVTSVDQLGFVPSDQEICRAIHLDGSWHIGWALEQPEAFSTEIAEWLAGLDQ